MIRILIILCCFLVQVHPAGALEITFSKSVYIDGSSITLGDIASFDEETEMTRVLGGQTLVQAPPPGEEVQLSSIMVKNHLLSVQPALGKADWRGSSTVIVRRRGVAIGPDRIQAIIDEFIAANLYDLPDADIRFVPDSPPLPFTVPTGTLTHQVIPSNPGIIGSSRFSIIFRVDDEVVKNMSVRGETQALAKVVVSARSLKKGQLLTADDLTRALVDISSDAGSSPKIDDFIGKNLKRNLRAGKALLDTMVENPPVVRRGERVKIVISSGNMLLTATGLAHADGSIDQMIRVENINSNKIIYCRVTAPGLVEVLL